MVRFILGTFALLGIVFFEMSGGTDFEPRRPPEVAEVKVETLPAAAPADEVTRLNVNLTSVTPQPGVESAAEIAAPEPVAKITLASVAVTEPAVAQEIQEPAAETEAVLPSLIRDVRSVKGSRVNMRSGPGKSFGVVNSLTRGTTVEILADPGNGWVRLRPADGGQIGWMADFLLTTKEG